MTGQRLLHYQILEKLGEGGMGVVYKARDTHLDRFVAVKVLPPEKVADPQRKARFVQEAKAASALNHPTIITIYDISSDAGTDFIVMEYVDGKTLDELIPRKGMRLNEALKHSVEIADALAKAHSAGIVHRDLKPGNVMVGEGGRVKVLDFGLAKLTERGGPDDETATMGVRTEEGTIVGTVAYMSPEQAEGRPVDVRSDIFSFGSLLYEMVTGRPAFKGDSRMSTLAAIIDKEPAPLSEDAPRDLQKLITRCLRKDPERRVRHMDDVKLALEELKEESASGLLATQAAKPKRGVWQPAVIAVLILGAAAGWWLWKQFRASEAKQAVREIPLTSDPGDETGASFSPDGMTVAFTRFPEIEAAQPVASVHLKMLGVENDSLLAEPGAGPAWSPDGRWLAFRLRSADAPPGRIRLMIVPPIGGTARRVTELGVSGSAYEGRMVWTPDGKWVIAEDRDPSSGMDHLMLVSPETGERKSLALPGGLLTGVQPALSPDGKWLAFYRGAVPGTGDLLVVPLDARYQPTDEPRKLPITVPDPNCPVWTADGKEIVFCSRVWHYSTLWRIRADGRGGARPLPFAGRGAYQPDIARRGNRLVYAKRVWNTDIWRVELDSSGRPARSPERFLPSNLCDYGATWSPDGARIAFVSERSGSAQIWVANGDGSGLAKLTSMTSTWGMEPRWSPGGEWLTFSPDADGNREIYIIPSGGGAPRRLTADPADDRDPQWSKDGKWVFFHSNRGGSERIWQVGREGGEARLAGVDVLGEEDSPGQWLYYLRSKEVPYAGLRQRSIWRKPGSGGESRQVQDGGEIRDFGLVRGALSVSRKGIYYGTVRRPGPGRTTFTAALAFHEFTTGKSVDILPLRYGTFSGTGLSVSPDGRYLLYTQREQESTDLMLVENFR